MSYTKPRANMIPYQLWHGRKPNVSHLCEFSMPVWVLLQGQRVQRKMLPKSLRYTYVGFDEGSKSIRYYNASMRNILTSRNFCFLSPADSAPPEEILVEPDALLEGEHNPPYEGEWGSDTRSITPMNGPRGTKKRKAEENVDTRAP